jgi:ElaB/YqjD/DUF883 family membrane-anchored ribosome-binding protein
MQQTADRSLHELQRETEQTRAGLTQTVDQLKASVTDTASEIRQRISPENIKAEVSSYVRSKGESMLEDITEAARRNPMQAVAVGASLAYPLFRFARAIPLPVLMVGAGLFFAGSKSGQSITQKASDMASDLSEKASDMVTDLSERTSDLSDELNRRSHDMSAQVGATVNSARDAVSDAVGQVGGALSAGRQEVRRNAASSTVGPGLTDRLKDTAASAGDAINARVADMKDGVSDVAGSAIDSSRDFVAAAKSAASSATDVGLQVARDARDKASDYSNRAGRTVLDTIQENPFLVAGVGLVIGGLIASALPQSELEEDLVGNAASAAKREVSKAASRGFEAAKGAAGEILQNVARQAGAEGLTPDQLDASAREIGQRVKRVAESAVTTAFDPDTSTQSNTGGRNHHG